MLRLSPEWTQLLDAYEELHADPRNQLCHDIGIPLVVLALPLALTGLGFAATAVTLLVGLFFLMLGHGFDGIAPAVADEPRHVPIAIIWWLERRGVEFDKPIKSEVEARK
jgi:uncharacterized membrane protein YGL010W